MKSKEENFLPIPKVRRAANWKLGMQYFIPEWDDRVDWEYNFLTDSFSSPNRDTYNDVYAHEIFPERNYDGILISKAVVDKSKKKQRYIEKHGARELLRYDGKIMGDCGAFGYIKEEEPPYTTAEILEDYKLLDVDYGVSVDHLIVGPFAEPGVREKRYELTLDNAFSFLQKHKTGDYNFTPIGVAQGWSPESYAEAVRELISMGYNYIALGGLARAISQEIIEILMAVRPNLTSKTRLHLFGVGRINAIPAFRHLGITSFDSASALRSAWLDSASNYHTLSGKNYPAIRIPPVDKHGLRIKRVIEAGVSTQKKLKKLERNSLKAMREFDKGKLSLEKTLEVVLAFDKLLELPRDGLVNSEAAARRQRKHAQTYRELLEEKPWKYCDCPICQELGVEVVIFRGNDRNRRRGFHNTYVFYKRFQKILNNGR